MERTEDIFESNKDVYDITNLKDKFGFIRYIISIMNFNDKKFKLKVMEFKPFSFLPVEIINEDFTDKINLFQSYRRLIDDYISIVKISDKDNISAEDIFDSAVNYKVQFPKCCLNCFYSLTDMLRGFPKFRELLCLNNENIRTYNSILENHGMHHKTVHNVKHINPHVNNFGICKNYREDKHKVQNIMKFIIEDTFKNDDDLKKIKGHDFDVHDLKMNEIEC